MDMRNPARAEMLTNFTPVLCFNALFGQSPASNSDDDTDSATPRGAAVTGEVSLKSICSLVERMWLHPAEADMHRSTYEGLMTQALSRCASPAARDGLVDVLRRVNGRDYVRALASLRAIAA